MDLSFLEKLDNEAIKEFIEEELDDLSRLSRPEEVGYLLRRAKELGLKLDAWVAAARTGHHISKEMTSHDSAKDKKYDALAKQDVVLDIRFKLLDIIRCQEILAKRGIRYNVDISRIPVNLQGLYSSMAERITGQKLVKEKELGRMRALSEKAKKGVALGFERIRKIVKRLR